ncbi:MAG: PAS domain S-box protein [Lentisphaerae bacterium]|nr:MAG: PAS domain S-box protein [Lentisphaerota bacterium]
MEYLLLFLLLTFIAVAILLLHRLAGVVGNQSFSLFVGALLVVGQIVTALEVHQHHPLPGLSVDVGPVVFMTPLMVVMILIYLLHGTIAAQRFLWGVIFLICILFYIFYQLEHLLLLPSIRIRSDVLGDQLAIARFFGVIRPFMLVNLLGILVEFLCLPMFFEILRQRKTPIFFSVTFAFLATQVLDSFFFELIVNPLHPFWLDHLRHVYMIRAIASIWLGILTTFYLLLCRREELNGHQERSPFELFVAFFGAYSQAQKLAKKLREWEGRYRLVLNASHDMILILDESGLILDANRAACQFLGQKDFTQQSNLFYRDVFTEPPWDSVWAQVYISRGGRWTILRRNLQYDITITSEETGNTIIIETVFSPVFIQNRPTILMVGRDVTARRQLEHDLQEQERQLMHAERMEAIGTLAGGVAHDFNNLLQAISGSLEQLEYETRNQSGKIRRLIHNIREASSRAAHLVNQLLGFARHGKYEMTPIAMQELIENVANLFEPVLDEKYRFRRAIHPSPMIVQGDATQLQQVILNLLLNARDATQNQNAPRIALRLEPASEKIPGWHLAPAGAQPDAFVVVRVKDNGPGIPDDVLPHIFEPFFTTKGECGTGMGLAMAYGIIENHHGWIHIETRTNSEKSGTEVILFLPKSKE